MNNPFQNIEYRLSRIEEAVSQLVSRKEPQPEKRYYSVSEAARKLHVAEITLYRNGKAGKIPVKKVGSRLMVPGSYVDDCIKTPLTDLQNSLLESNAHRGTTDS